MSRILPALLQLTLGAALAIAGPLTVTLTTDTLSGNPGSVLIFTGTFTNESSDPVYINDFNFSPEPTVISGADFILHNLFTTNTWLDTLTPLAGGATSALVNLFSVEIPTTGFLDFGTHDGTFIAANGASDAFSDLTDASANFHVTVTEGASTPEPGTVGLLFAGAWLGFLTRRRALTKGR